MRKWQRGRNRRRRGPASGSDTAGAAPPLQPIIPDSIPDDIGNRVEPEPSEESEEPNFNRYPSEIEQRQRQQQGGGGGRGRRGGRGGRDRNQPQPPRGVVGDAPPAGQPSAGQPSAGPPPPAGAQPGEGGGGRRRRRRRGGRGRGERPPEQQIPRDATGSGALVPNYPEERFEAPQQPVSEVAPELPAAQPEPPRPAPHPATPRKPKGVVVLAIGLPGSGKSSWFKRRGVTPLSSDVLRNLLFDDIAEQRYQDLVFSTLRSLLRARMIARMPWNYVDATNLNPKERHGWIKMAREFGYEVHAVFFDVPVEVCLARNLRRARVVPEDIMQRMAQKLRPPTFEEGFSKIIVVRVKRRDDEPTSEVQGQPEAETLGEEEEEGLEES